MAHSYRPTQHDAHARDEELQWARILAQGDAARSMVLLLEQKMCTAFHEFAPTARAGILPEDYLPQVRGRLAARLGRVLQTVDANGLGELTGVDRLRRIHGLVLEAATLQELADLAETVHAASHILADALEAA